VGRKTVKYIVSRLLVWALLDPVWFFIKLVWALKNEIYVCHPTGYSRAILFFSILPFLYISSECYKMKNLKNIIHYLSIGRYNGRVFFSVSATYVSNRYEYFGKILGAREN
jgi:hypothetical protein